MRRRHAIGIAVLIAILSSRAHAQGRHRQLRRADFGDGGANEQKEAKSHPWMVKGESLDRPYIERWLDDLAVRELWDRVHTEVD